MILGLLAAPCVSTASAEIGPQNVLVLWNSQNADSQAVRDLYVARYPGVHEFDLNDTVLDRTGQANNNVTRANYVARVVEPLRDFINGDAAPFVDISQEVMVIMTTRGLPGIINSVGGNDEFQINASWTSLESELVLLQQDLEQVGAGLLGFRYSGCVDNPYHQALNQPIDSFSRLNVQTQHPFVRVFIGAGAETWTIPSLTPGGMYLVTRLDAVPTDVGTAQEVTAIEHIERLLDRSMRNGVIECGVQSLLDEFASPANELDDDGLGSVYPFRQDFENTASALAGNGFDVLHDQSADFVTGPELPDARPVLVLGTYGENHNVGGFGENAPGSATYIETYDFAHASIFVAYESFNGTSLWNPDNNRVTQQEQVLDYIVNGGTFGMAHVREPFTFPVADLEYLTQNMLVHGMTFAEAAYASLPALSWMNVPVGDPLAKINLVDPGNPDRDGDGDVDIEDLYRHAEFPVDLTCDGSIDSADNAVMKNAARAGEAADVTTN